jgi:GWxTD domain-containing protein
MNIRKFLIATIVAAVAVGAFALTPEHTEWAKGPASYLMTKEEAAQWKNITSDEQAQKFVDLFWARRDPTPATAENEFKALFDERVRYSDEKFAYRGKKGSMTDRGKLFILFGAPSKAERATTPDRPSTGSITEPEEVSLVWLWEGDAATKNFNLRRAEIKLVDRFANGDYRIETGAVNVGNAQQRVVTAAITQPNLTEVPKYGQAAAPVAMAPVAAPVAAPAAPAAAPAMTEFKTPAFKTAVTEFKAAKKNPYDKPIYVSWSESVTSEGETFVPVSVYVPKAAGLAASQSVTFFGSVEDASGNPVAVFEEPVTLNATKDDVFFDKSLKLPAGKFRGTFGIADAGKPVTMISTDMQLAGTIDTAAEATSGLILSNNIFPMAVAQTPTEPYAFGGLKVVPKGDKAFSQADDLWYFIEIRNPGLGEDKMPKLQAKIEVEGTDTTGKKVKMSAPPSEAHATEFKGMTGHWGIGSAIPLATFKPGSYSMSIKLMDTVNKTSYTVKNDFKVVPGAAPAAPPAQ